MTLLQDLGETWTAVTERVDGLGPVELRLPTRSESWTVRELLFHLLLDAQRALVTMATPERGPADTDAVGYWRGFGPDRDPAASAAHAAFVRRAAAAWSDDALRAEWRDTSAAAFRSLRAAGPSSRVATQGHVLTVSAFTHTLLVEATVHLHDLGLRLAPQAVPAGGLTAVREVLTGLLGSPLPQEWDDATALLKGTGRARLDLADQLVLGDRADRFPLFG